MRDKPTSEQMEVIIAYAQKKGRYWKQALRDEWMSAHGSSEPELQQVRNTLGPIWLNNFRLPKS